MQKVIRSALDFGLIVGSVVIFVCSRMVYDDICAGKYTIERRGHLTAVIRAADEPLKFWGMIIGVSLFMLIWLIVWVWIVIAAHRASEKPRTPVTKARSSVDVDELAAELTRVK